MKVNLKRELEYYIAHQDELVAHYNGRYVVIKNAEVIGVYDSEIQAVQETAKHHQLGTFMVQKCEPGQESYTQVFHSRVAFA